VVLFPPVRYAQQANLLCFFPAALLVTDVGSLVPNTLVLHTIPLARLVCSWQHRPPLLSSESSRICSPACTTPNPIGGSGAALFPCLPHDDAHSTGHFRDQGPSIRALVHRLYYCHTNGHLHLQHTDSLELSARILPAHLTLAWTTTQHTSTTPLGAILSEISVTPQSCSARPCPRAAVEGSPPWR